MIGSDLPRSTFVGGIIGYLFLFKICSKIFILTHPMGRASGLQCYN